MFDNLRNILHQREGPLTDELRRAEGPFDLGQLPAERTPDSLAKCVCGFCSTGCSLTIHLKRGKAVGLSPTVEYPVNLGMACPKGWEALSVLRAPDRATMPLLRQPDGSFAPIDWDRALRTFVERFGAVQDKYGREAVAFLGTGQLPTEELAYLGALAKFGMGMIHGDGNTRQCMATAVVAYKESFGFDAPPYTYQDFEESDVVVLVGSNLCITHPIMWQRLMRNPRQPQIIVLDPRRTETAMCATQHLALAPKSDLALLYGVVRLLIVNGWIDEGFIARHTQGFGQFAEFVDQFTLESVSTATGLAAPAIEAFARAIHEGERVSFWWTMGVNQSHQGVRTAQAIINLALMTGNIGRPGTGANSITGQCNAMGSRLFSNTTNLLGGRDFENAQHRADVAGILGLDPARIPNRNSWSYDQILEGILRGAIRGLWIVCTNTAHSWINQDYAVDVLKRLDFLVVQDMYHTTETARCAHLVLPAAGWGEKDGTFINSERRIGGIKKVTDAPGQARSDFEIFQAIARYWGCHDLFEAWDSPAAVFQILKQLSRDQPCDFSGIVDEQMLEELGGVQWPLSEGHTSPATHRRLFADGLFFHVDGKARFIFEPPRPLTEPPSERFPLILLTGRGNVAQWHTDTRTSKSAVLRSLSPSSLVAEINPADAERFGIRPNDWIFVESPRGQVRARAFLTPTIAPGQVFLPMHDARTNHLTDAVFDPYSKQPAYKACSVRIQRA
jgi:assimilatory nitrate reductase catalytic subunit